MTENERQFAGFLSASIQNCCIKYMFNTTVISRRNNAFISQAIKLGQKSMLMKRITDYPHHAQAAPTKHHGYLYNAQDPKC